MLGVTALLAYYVSAYHFQLMVIQGQSMYPSYHNYQLVILDKQSKEFKPGDVVAFQCETVGSLLVKRIVAVPGDTVLVRNGILYVNGMLDMEALSRGKIMYAGLAESTITLLEGEFFVLGDNYEYSRDSRYVEIGNVQQGSIAGTVLP
ncbi:MAG: signal peptidase I [Eubacterium sp.]|nr:signal peptidase I [Eubacterium sp.]